MDRSSVTVPKPPKRHVIRIKVGRPPAVLRGFLRALLPPPGTRDAFRSARPERVVPLRTTGTRPKPRVSATRKRTCDMRPAGS